MVSPLFRFLLSLVCFRDQSCVPTDPFFFLFPVYDLLTRSAPPSCAIQRRPAPGLTRKERARRSCLLERQRSGGGIIRPSDCATFPSCLILPLSSFLLPSVVPRFDGSQEIRELLHNDRRQRARSTLHAMCDLFLNLGNPRRFYPLYPCMASAA